MTFADYFWALFLTLTIELSVVYLFGYKTKKALLVSALVSLVTHPIFGYFLWINIFYNFISINFFSLIPIEILIALVESLLLYYALDYKYSSMLKLSFAMNTASFLLGTFITHYL